jgi:hypothetical protein
LEAEKIRSIEFEKNKVRMDRWRGQAKDEAKSAKIRRKEEILKKEEDAELKMRKKSNVIDKQIKAEAVGIKAHKKVQKEISSSKHWAESHFIKAAYGSECPDGWSPVLNRDTCKLAQKVLGGHEKVSEALEDPRMPGGCFYSIDRKLVLFNDYPGAPNSRTERYCESTEAMSGSNIFGQYKKVVAAEMQKQDDEMRKLAAKEEDARN